MQNYSIIKLFTIATKSYGSFFICVEHLWQNYKNANDIYYQFVL